MSEDAGRGRRDGTGLVYGRIHSLELYRTVRQSPYQRIDLCGSVTGISGLICVDQSPAQYTGPDWQWGQKGCYDVEMFIPNIKLPTLVCVARNSNVFDWHGSAWVGENIPGAKTVFFENSGHMLFWEEPDKFNQTVAEFVKNH